jgi:hypothetical protein
LSCLSGISAPSFRLVTTARPTTARPPPLVCTPQVL